MDLDYEPREDSPRRRLNWLELTVMAAIVLLLFGLLAPIFKGEHYPAHRRRPPLRSPTATQPTTND